MYMFHAFWQFRNCIAHSVSCQIACRFLNAYTILKSCNESILRNLEIDVSEQDMRRCWMANYSFAHYIHALYSRFQLASCSYRTHTPLNIIIALRWTPRALNTKLKCWFLQQCHDGRGSLALISMNINLFVETGVRSSTSNPRGYRLENPRPWCYVP